MTRPIRVKVELLRCPNHGFEALSIGNTRITEGKCCGRWETVRTFAIPFPEEIARIVEDEYERLLKIEEGS